MLRIKLIPNTCSSPRRLYPIHVLALHDRSRRCEYLRHPSSLHHHQVAPSPLQTVPSSTNTNPTLSTNHGEAPWGLSGGGTSHPLTQSRSPILQPPSDSHRDPQRPQRHSFDTQQLHPNPTVLVRRHQPNLRHHHPSAQQQCS